MPNASYTTPILFIIFNRPGESLKVLEAIRQVKPANLYIAADGPRTNNSDDFMKCEEVRNAVLASIDWDCNIRKLFRESNLGCRLAVSGSINWFFEHEEMGIIIEDDCFADKSFFYFCNKLLTRYKNDDNIIAINGCNFNFKSNTSGSYFFSRYINVWGWATWKRSAKMIDYNMSSWRTNTSKLIFLWTKIRSNFFDFDLDWYRYWKKNFDAITGKVLDTWDYQWQYHQWLTGKKTVVASKNLVVNIGFGEGATHTSMNSHPASALTLDPLEFPLKEPFSKEIDKEYEEVSIKPLWHLHSRKPNWFYFFNYINTIPFIQSVRSRFEK